MNTRLKTHVRVLALASLLTVPLVFGLARSANACQVADCPDKETTGNFDVKLYRCTGTPVLVTGKWVFRCCSESGGMTGTKDKCVPISGTTAEDVWFPFGGSQPPEQCVNAGINQ